MSSIAYQYPVCIHKMRFPWIQQGRASHKVENESKPSNEYDLAAQMCKSHSKIECYPIVQLEVEC